MAERRGAILQQALVGWAAGVADDVGREMRVVVALAVALWALIGCAGNPAASAALSQREAQEVTSYQLGPRDKVRITVFGQKDLSGEFALDGDGMIGIPLIGAVKGQGLTSRELGAAIADKLRGPILLSPDVQVEVVTFRPYYILGEIARPGEYPYSSGLTVVNAVAAAQGYTTRGDKRRIFIRRAGESAEVEYVVHPLVAVRPGDTLRVPERWF